MKKMIAPPIPGAKDQDGMYIKQQQESVKDEGELSLDNLLAQGLLTIKRALGAVSRHVVEQYPLLPEREAIMNLKDIMHMLHELKDKENEILEELSLEELEQLIQAKQESKNVTKN